jgi:hypothetical protein
MTRDDWCAGFFDELLKLRPHMGHRLARTLAMHHYKPAEHPRDLARQYHKQQQPQAAPAKKRAK